MDRHLSIAATVLLSLCSVYVFTLLPERTQALLLVVAGGTGFAIGLVWLSRKAILRWGPIRVGGSAAALACLVGGLAYWSLRPADGPWAGFKKVEEPASEEWWRTAPPVKDAPGLFDDLIPKVQPGFKVERDFNAKPLRAKITGPEGSAFEVKAPEGATPEQFEAKIAELIANWSSVLKLAPYENWPNIAPKNTGEGAAAN